MKVLVAGGLGFIGSHTVVELLNEGFEVVVVDNLYNSHESVLEKIEIITGKKIKFYKYDVSCKEKMEEVFKAEKTDAIIHFAGYKAVGESVQIPLEYYKNNLLTTIVLASLAKKYEVKKFIFSSSATVYGKGKSPFSEKDKLGETSNPYGETKKMCERILKDFSNVNLNMTVIMLRYFNPIGAHSSGLIGELPQGIPNNLMPYVTQVASGKLEKLYVFGNDYKTIDGSGIRDYIHVVDLARGHILALKSDKKGYLIYNLGTGKGVSVLEIINTFKKVNNIDIFYEIVGRRKGDLAEVYADVKKAEEELNFKTRFNIEDMVRDSWNFEKNRK